MASWVDAGAGMQQSNWNGYSPHTMLLPISNKGHCLRNFLSTSITTI